MVVKRLSLAQPQTGLVAQPDLSPAHKKAIEGALRWAWAQLVARRDKVLHEGCEESITEAIETLLGRIENGRRLAPGLKDFGAIPRGAKQRTSDGRIGKEPDLVFRPLVHNRRVTNLARWGCFVECKLIETGHTSRNLTNYSMKGIRRFACGEYAAWMPSGMMLAYVRNKSQPAASLDALLPLHGAKAVIAGQTADICSTVHPRGLLVPPCVDITLTHLWLRAQ